MKDLRFYSPNEGGGPGEIEPPVLDAAGNPIAEPAKPAVAEDFAKQLSKTYSEGLGEGKKRYLEETLGILRNFGIEIQAGENGKPDIAKSLAAFQGNAAGATEAVKQLQRQYENELAVERQKSSQLTDTLKRKEIQHQLSSSLLRHETVSREGAMQLFLARYNLDEQDGNIQVLNKDGSLVYDPKTGSASTLDATVDLFLKSEPYLVKATTRDGVGELARKGSPTPMDPRKLSEAFMAEKDPVKKAQLREQMMTGIGNGAR